MVSTVPKRPLASSRSPDPASPTQPSLRRLREFGVRPKRDLGQNFLVDSNLLDVIARAAQLGAGDVVLEIGGGLGVLSEHIAERVEHLHVVELDRALEPALRDALDPCPNAQLHLGDAMRLDLAALDPAPTKVVANLPYSIAAGAILRTVADLPGVTTWVGMVQKEVGERFAAAPATPAYGLPSVLAQLACDVRVLRAVSRTVFHPVPNVDSVLLGLRRTGPAAEPGLRALVHAAFAHRRKALAGSLALAAESLGGALAAGGRAGAQAGSAAAPVGDSSGAAALGRELRERTRAALTALGHPADARAERLSPEDFRALYEALRA